MRFQSILPPILIALILAITAFAAEPQKPAPAKSPRPAKKTAAKPAPAPAAPKPALKEIVIRPRNIQAAKPAPATEFELAHTQGKLALIFQSKDPTLHLDRSSPFVVQLDMEDPLEVEPSVINAENWPKSGDRMMLSYKNARAGEIHSIVVSASYKVCSSKTKKCSKERSRTHLEFKP